MKEVKRCIHSRRLWYTHRSLYSFSNRFKARPIQIILMKLLGSIKDYSGLCVYHIRLGIVVCAYAIEYYIGLYKGIPNSHSKLIIDFPCSMIAIW